MLTRAENELICRVGPEAPMGRTMRRYWHPACTSAELPGPDADPIRVRLLGENFVAFRDSNGQVGVLDELCMHRGASLVLGRVEDCGIRCLYHGWKFGVDGSIQETPNHADERFRQRFTAPAYPVREEAGLVWVYLGPRDTIPEVPRFPFMDLPEANRTVIRVNVPANYLQLVEGGIDSSHVGILHSDLVRPGWLTELAEVNYNPATQTGADLAPTLEIENTDFGFHYAAVRRPGGATDQVNIRITPFILPYGRIIPPGTFTVFEVPMDDEHTATYLIFADAKAPVDRQKVIKLLGIGDSRVWQDADFWFLPSWREKFYQDRDRMRARRTWSGLRGLEQEDAVMSISMGPIFDRSREHVVPADRAVIRARRLLLDCVRRVESGEDPIGVVWAGTTTLQAPDQTVSSTTRWQSLAPQHHAVGTDQPEPELVA